MANRYQLITELYKTATKQITARPAHWTAFLQSACRNYKCRFDEQVLIYAQRPDATAVLEIKTWNRAFGRWVNRGARSIAVFDSDKGLKHYFDVSDTHLAIEGSRPVPIWAMKPEYEPEAIEALENTFGDLSGKSDLGTAILSAAQNAVIDNMGDYLRDLWDCRDDSFLEELDEDNVTKIYRDLLQYSIAYMMMVRCDIDPNDYIDPDYFGEAINFNTPATINALGIATGDIAKIGLLEIATTVLDFQKRERRTFADSEKVPYDGAKEINTLERSAANESDIQQTGRLRESEPASSADRDNPWEIRPASQTLSGGEPASDVHEPVDIGTSERTFDGDREYGESTDSPDGNRDGENRGRDGGVESHRPDEVGGANEQSPAVGGGNGTPRSDLQLDTDEKADSNELSAFLDETLIMGIIANKQDDLKYKKSQIELFFDAHSDEDERGEYLKDAYQDRYTEVLVDGKRVGYKPEEDGLLMWEGSYLSRTSESVFSWGLIAEFTDSLIKKKEYYIAPIIPLPSIQGQQMNLFGFGDTSENTIDPQEQGQMSIFKGFEISQQIIDEVLCLGSNEPYSLEHICAHFAKDYPLEINAAFLKDEYGTDGKGFFSGNRHISVWYDESGIRIDEGRTAMRGRAVIVSWSDAAKRIRELLDLGRFAPQEILDSFSDVEYKDLSESLWYLVQNLSGDAHDAGFIPSILEIYNGRGGFPDNTAQIAELIKSSDHLSTIIAELEHFCQAYSENRELLRFRISRPKEILDRLKDLQREYLPFTVQPDFVSDTKQFISDDEIEKLLTGGNQIQHGKYRILSFFISNTTAADRIKYLKNEYGMGGSGRLGFNENHDSKGIEYKRKNTHFEPYATVLLKWPQVEKLISKLIAQNRYMSPVEIEGIPEYERGEVARAVYHFFYEVPQEQPRPFPHGFEFNDAIEIIEPLLLQADKVSEIYQMMLPVWEGTAQDNRFYESRKKGIEYLTAYRDGTFSLFGAKKEIMTARELPAEKEETAAPVPEPETEQDSGLQVIKREIVQTPLFEVELVQVHVPQPDEPSSENVEHSEVLPVGIDLVLSENPTPADNIPAPPAQRRERVNFSILQPEMPSEQRRNFRITDPRLGEGTPSEKFSNNMAAIRTLKNIEDEQRLATPEEQEILSKYVAWGGLASCFEETHMKNGELKHALTDEEYAAARAGTLTAFYTPPVVIEGIYKALEQMGFHSGNILDPACGIGNFIGMLPESMADSKVYGVEIDSIPGRIARQLYQNSSIAVSGFEKVDIPDSFFDVAIGNVPFGDFKVSDQRYDKHKWLIHDYFFGATLDKVRPGGIVAFITSKGTLDKENPAVRKYLAQRADLIGAIRLPNTTFKRNAGTEVTSDIIFLQKRDRIIDIEPDWIHLDTDENGIRMNSYFVQNPDMILGEMEMVSGQFGPESVCKPYDSEDLSDSIANAITNLHAEITEYDMDELDESEDLSIPADPDVRNFSYAIVDGKLYFRDNARMHPVNASATAENRIRGMITLRDCTRRLIEYQTENYPDSVIKDEQNNLNRLYDTFFKKYGLINSRGNSLAFSEDSAYYLLCSLEVLDDEGNFKRKADMFSKRTIKPHVPVTSVDTASEALAVSISEKARVDLPFMARLSGIDEETLIKDLKGVIFLNIGNAEFQEKTYVTADEYLSGNVRKKLEKAKAAQSAIGNGAFDVNVTALEAAQPEDLTAAEIGVRIGATWVPAEIYKQFMFELFGTSGHAQNRMGILYSKYSGEWNISYKHADSGNIKTQTTYGTSRINAYNILEQTLNLKDVRIFDTKIENGNEIRVLNKKETANAQDRQELIKSKFTEWIWKDIDRREKLCGIYNEIYNSTRPREYDGSHITFVGMNPEISLRPHQINAIARVLYGGNTLLAHQVGAGKTYEMVASAMESKRLGLCAKSLVTVPNHIVGQFAGEWLQLYPSANILVATKKDFETKNRKKFCARISTGDFDAVIIGHSQFEKIPMSQERQEIILQQQIDEMTFGIREAKSSNAERYTIKQMERTRKSIETKLQKLNDQNRKDSIVTYEELGCDRLFVDESHFFKNLFLMTKMRNVGGIAQTEAQKSSDLFMKCRYLDELTGGRGIVFATGTPISNSMVEMYTIQRYLQFDVLGEMGLRHFDEWAASFGETVTAIELSPEGTGYRAKTRFAKFFNLPELMTIFKQVADIQTADMLNLPVPKANFHTEVIAPSALQKKMVAELAKRAEVVRKREISPDVDNMLLITNDGRKLALDMRLINPLAPNDENGKIAVCANNIYRIWERTAEKRSAQLVFCDLSTPKGVIETVEIYDVFRAAPFQNVYTDLKEKLIARGIPAEEIAFIHEANTDARKAELFGKVRSGQVRVLIGSTQKMGAGTNVQTKLVALHDLDCPWRPSDLEQRLGRIVRQGNENPEVDIFRYVTEGTFDSYLYQLVENKQRFISQIMTSKTPLRVAEDVDESALSYAEIKALATGNPLIVEKCQLDMEVGKLNMLKASHLSQKYALEELVIRRYPKSIVELTARVEGYEQDVRIAAANPKPSDAFSPMEILGTIHAEKENAGKAIIDACTKMTSSDAVPLGQYRGFSMSLAYSSINNEYSLSLKGTLFHSVALGADIYGNITRIDNLIEGLGAKLENVKSDLSETERQFENARIEMDTPFARETELAEKTAKLNSINALLNVNETDKSVVDTSPEESEQAERKEMAMAR